jgi:Na+:H+ antiporter, NhaA family
VVGDPKIAAEPNDCGRLGHRREVSPARRRSRNGDRHRGSICEHPGTVNGLTDRARWHRGLARRVTDPVQEFLETESSGGIVLALAAVAAIVWATVATRSYATFWGHHLGAAVGWNGHLTLQDVAREGLMPVFFFVVGLEIKREITVGELAHPRLAVVPVVAAAGGMVVPALLYLAVAGGGPGAEGWGIPMATDIAFVVGALQLLGSRVPTQLKVFMLAIAVVDDIGAIIVIALAYSRGVQPVWLALSAVCLALGWGLMRAGVRQVPVFVGLAVVGCLATAIAGVSPTIVAVMFGLMIPMAPWRPGSGDGPTAVERLEHLIHPWSAFVVLPLFALASAGIPLTPGAIRHAATDPIAIGVVLGLVVGKPVGVLGATWAAVRLRLGALPQGLGWGQLACGAALAGIGFTVAIFIATLAFPDRAQLDVALLGVLAGSLIAAAAGTAIARIPGGS